MQDAIFDTCCFINLFASGDFPGFMTAVPWSWHLPVAARKESLYVRSFTEAGEEYREPIAVAALIESAAPAMLRSADLADADESTLYVELAAELDDGEAMALAIASQRGWTLATDDRKARRFADGLGVTVVTTPEIMRLWADAGRLTTDYVSELLFNVETRARFVPRHGAVDGDWWNANRSMRP